MAQDGNGQDVEQYNRKHLAILEKIIDKASSDPAWKQQLLSDPQAAFDEAGLLPDIDALNPALWDKDDVTGQSMVSLTILDCCKIWPLTDLKPIRSV